MLFNVVFNKVSCPLVRLSRGPQSIAEGERVVIIVVRLL